MTTAAARTRRRTWTVRSGAGRPPRRVEVWLVDVVARVLEVCTLPGPEGHASVSRLTDGDVSPAAAPDLVVPVADLLGPA